MMLRGRGGGPGPPRSWPPSYRGGRRDIQPVPVAGSMLHRGPHAVSTGRHASTSRPYSSRLCQARGSFYYRLPGATARVASTLIDSVLAAPGTWPRLAARLYRPPGATAAYSQTSLSRCPGAPYGGPCPDCVVDGRDPTGPGSTRHVTTPPERLA